MNYPAKYAWHLEEPGDHATATMEDGRPTTMEREVLRLDPDDPRKVLHLNGNTLDNRKNNLKTVGSPWN